MRFNLLLVLAMIGGVKNSFADMGQAYFFKATIITTDTTFTGYFQGPYESLADSTLARFKANDRYFKNRVISDTQQDGFQVYNFIYKYQFKTEQGETLFALSHSSNTYRLKKRRSNPFIAWM